MAALATSLAENLRLSVQAPADPVGGPSLSPAQAREDNGNKLKIVCYVFAVLSPLLVGLRLWARTRTVHGVSWDDWAIVAALAFSLVTTGLTIAQVDLGFGRHVQTIAPSDLRYIEYIFWWVEVTAIAPHMTKISLLLLYMRVFDHVRWLSRTCVGFVIFIALWAVVQVLLFVFQCWPVQKGWNPLIEGTCLLVEDLFYLRDITSIVIDVILMFLPIHYVWKLRVPQSQRYALFSVFSLGIVTIFTVAMRIPTIPDALGDTDPTFNITPGIWMLLEIHLGNVCATLPTLRVVLVRILPEIFRSRSATGAGGSGSNSLGGGGPGHHTGTGTRTSNRNRSSRLSLSNPLRSTRSGQGVFTQSSSFLRLEEDDNAIEMDRLRRLSRAYVRTSQIRASRSIGNGLRMDPGPNGIVRTVEFDLEIEETSPIEETASARMHIQRAATIPPGW
ncbi:hypothetical protein B0H63DRAFT_519901 [Podospora didyma]|uniref:Rhodopsin domain-containing protein n=1 Tax=Podospora didyma TaxID=330526 RepID=A0AAE0NZP8_9PEZI|nr:hypothetical protein B0H63DRAFT_519901 [Podospora didyma]